MDTTLTGLGTHHALLPLALHIRELSMSAQKATEAGITVRDNQGTEELIPAGWRDTDPSHPSPHGELPRLRRTLRANRQRVEPSTPRLPTIPSAAPEGYPAPGWVPEDPSPRLSGEAWARRSPPPVGPADGEFVPPEKERPRSEPRSHRAPQGKGPPSPFLGRRNPAWQRGERAGQATMSCPHTAGSDAPSRRGAPLSEGLTCRLQPPGPPGEGSPAGGAGERQRQRQQRRRRRRSSAPPGPRSQDGGAVRGREGASARGGRQPTAPPIPATASREGTRGGAIFPPRRWGPLGGTDTGFELSHPPPKKERDAGRGVGGKTSSVHSAYGVKRRVSR